jgi:hypothetical protein
LQKFATHALVVGRDVAECGLKFFVGYGCRLARGEERLAVGERALDGFIRLARGSSGYVVQDAFNSEIA